MEKKYRNSKRQVIGRYTYYVSVINKDMKSGTEI